MEQNTHHHTLIRLLATALLALSVSGCADIRKNLHDWAIGTEIKRAGLEERDIDLDDKRIAYLQSESPSEDQEVILMVHGFAANKQNWLRLAREFRDDYHVIALDLPGHGDSIQDPDLSYGIGDQANHVAAFMDALDLSSAHLIGSSMGGAIVSVLASTHPERVRTLTLMAPAGVREHSSELDEYLAEGRNPLIIDDTDGFDELMDFVMEERPFIPWPVGRVIAERHMANQDINQVIFEDIRRNADADFRKILVNIEAPTLVLWGEKDRVINVANANVMREHIPDVRVEVLEGIGHAPMIEATETSARHIRRLLTPDSGG